ncbi:MAG: FmdB family zinc ribbon protein, partial [Actinomycetota bacterium]
VSKFIDSGETIEIYQAFSEEALTEAPHPSDGKMRKVKKVFTPVGITFKGGGFYKTDSSSQSNTGTKTGTQTGTNNKTTTDAGASSPSSSSTESSSGSTSSTSSSSPTAPTPPTNTGKSATPAKSE